MIHHVKNEQAKSDGVEHHRTLPGLSAEREVGAIAPTREGKRKDCFKPQWELKCLTFVLAGECPIRSKAYPLFIARSSKALNQCLRWSLPRREYICTHTNTMFDPGRIFDNLYIFHL